jgi:hypothetical protein
MRFPFLSCLVLLAAPLARAADQPAPLEPVLPPAPVSAPQPTAVPATLDAVTFGFQADGEEHKVVVTTTPASVRFDETTDGYSVIYNTQSQFYTGLEHRNYTYWTFSWPEVSAAVQSSKRHEQRLQDLNNQGLSGDSSDTPPLTSSASAPASTPDDDSGYLWRVTTDHKRIADLDCVRWTGDTVTGMNVEAWCYAGPLPKVQAAIAQLQVMSDPMALVPVRNIVPDFIFPVYAALERGGVTPLLINWGDGETKNHFRFLGQKAREGSAALFTVPKLYIKTTLVTMDGLIKEQPVHEPEKVKPQKTWQTQ